MDPRDQPTAPVVAVADRPKHGRRAGSTGPTGSQWLRVAVPAGVAFLALGAAAFALSRSGGHPADHSANRAATTTTTEQVTTSVASGSAPPAGGASSASSSTTTAAEEDPTSESTTTVPTAADPLALCSDGQRTAIERGNHPWDWYVERFDRDGDGILCN